MTEHSEGVEELVDALLEGYAPISVIFDHMLKAKPQPTVNDVRSALGGILKETLQPLATRFGSHDLLTTAAVIEATVPLVHEDIHLVSHDFTEGKLNRRERRRRSRGGELLPATTKEVMDALPKPSGHVAMVDALIELATSTSRILDDLAQAPDVPDRAAAEAHLRDAFYELLAPISLLLGPRDLKAATAVVEAAANIVVHRFDYAPCDVIPLPRRDPREAHRRLRGSTGPRRGART